MVQPETDRTQRSRRIAFRRSGFEAVTVDAAGQCRSNGRRTQGTPPKCCSQYTVWRYDLATGNGQDAWSGIVIATEGKAKIGKVECPLLRYFLISRT